MLPARKFFGQNFMPDFFNDLFDNVSLENRGFKSPAINVIEDDNKYCIELAAPGMAKDDFKVHVNKDGNLVIEMEKKENCHFTNYKLPRCSFKFVGESNSVFLAINYV